MIDNNDENEDIEIEAGNEDLKIGVPFDPSQINIKIIPRNIGQLIEMLQYGEILIPRYQRLPNLWSDTKKSRFIESLMLDLPIPLFYFDEAEDNKWFVVDGLQRMSTLEHFVLGKGDVSNNKEQLLLQDLEFLTQYNGKTWEGLPRDIKRRINSNQVTINLIGKGTPDEVKYTIFSRINQGDVPLKAQEIRTALFQGYRIDFLESLVSADLESGQLTESGQLFAKATGGSIKARRQEDLNFISRFIAFYLIDFNKYEPDMDRFITKGTKEIPIQIKEQQKIREDFNKSMQIAIDIFGKYSFRKRVNKDDARKPINKPIFEVVAVTFAKLSQEEINKLMQNKDAFIDKFIELQNNSTTFWNAITTGTATKESVISRNKEFRSMLKTFVS
jgi:Protein of unknown function DUF262